MTVILKHATRWRFLRCYRCQNSARHSAGGHFFFVSTVVELDVLRGVPVPTAISRASVVLMDGIHVRRRRGQLQVEPCAHISTEVKVFSLAESQAELILKMYSMSTYSANFVIENGDNFRVSGARVPTARPSPPARARS